MSQLLLTCKSLPRARFSLRTMAGQCTIAYVQNVAQIERMNQLTDNAMLIMGFVGAARTVLPRGRRAVEAMIRRMAGSANVDFEEVLSQVEFPEDEPTADSDYTDLDDNFGRRNFEFQNMALTPTSPPLPRPPPPKLPAPTW